MADYCLCGNVATLLCRQCGRPMCITMSEGTVFFEDMDIGDGIVIDGRAESGQLICRECSRQRMQSELEVNSVRDLVPEKGPFIRSAFISYFLNHGKSDAGQLELKLPNPVSGMKWKISRAKGPYLHFTSIDEFSDSFLPIARKFNWPLKLKRAGAFTWRRVYTLPATSTGGEHFMSDDGRMWEADIYGNWKRVTNIDSETLMASFYIGYQAVRSH